MSEALISSQQGEINRLNSELAKARQEAGKYRKDRNTVRAELQALQGKHTELEGRFSELDKAAKAAPSETQQRLDAALKEIRTFKHRAAFDKAAKAAGVDEGRLDDFYQLSGYQPEAEAIDEGAIQGKVTEALAARGYFAKAADGGKPADAGTQPPQAPPQGDGPGARRGGNDPAAGGASVRGSDLSNPEWMMQNGKLAAEACKAGRVNWNE